MPNPFNTVIFDFNGLILDDEHLHLELFQRVLLEEEITLTEKDYWDIYMGFDDKGLFKAIYEANGLQLGPTKLKALIEKKASLYLPTLKGKVRFFSGVIDFIKQLAGQYTLAVVSGALKPEIEFALDEAQVKDHFRFIIAAEDTKHGKPDPEGYLLALAKLKQENNSIRSDTCLVLEDSLAGIESAHRAQMKVAALTHTFPKNLLTEADWVVDTFAELNRLLKLV